MNKALFIILSIALLIIGTVYLIKFIKKDQRISSILILIPIGGILFFFAGRYNLLWTITDRIDGYYQYQHYFFIASLLPFFGLLITKIKRRKLRITITIITTILTSYFAVGFFIAFSYSCLIYLCMYLGFVLILYSKIKEDLILACTFFFSGLFGLGYAHIDNENRYTNMLRVYICGNTYWVEDYFCTVVFSSEGKNIIPKSKAQIGFYEYEGEIYIIKVYKGDDDYILKIYGH